MHCQAPATLFTESANDQGRELVTQNEDLQVLGGVATGQLSKQLDGAAQRQVGESWQHLEAASATG